MSKFSRGCLCQGEFLLLIFCLALFFAMFVSDFGLEGLQDHGPEAGIDLFQVGQQLILGRRDRWPPPAGVRSLCLSASASA